MQMQQHSVFCPFLPRANHLFQNRCDELELQMLFFDMCCRRVWGEMEGSSGLSSSVDNVGARGGISITTSDCTWAFVG